MKSFEIINREAPVERTHQGRNICLYAMNDRESYCSLEWLANCVAKKRRSSDISTSRNYMNLQLSKLSPGTLERDTAPAQWQMTAPEDMNSWSTYTNMCRPFWNTGSNPGSAPGTLAALCGFEPRPGTSLDIKKTKS